MFKNLTENFNCNINGCLFHFGKQQGYSQSRTIIKNVNEALSLAMKNNSEIVKANIDKLIAEEKYLKFTVKTLFPQSP
ncbi:MAG: hypothetical protein IPH77_14435 [Ignavibacteria bacterium]|nr:hypothetical protein [Ignavibacteria bacterium]